MLAEQAQANPILNESRCRSNCVDDAISRIQALYLGGRCTKSEIIQAYQRGPHF